MANAGLSLMLSQQTRRANYRTVIPLGTGKNSDGDTVSTALVTTGTTKAEFLHLVDIGARFHHLEQHRLSGAIEHTFDDIIFYGGYRYVADYDVVMAVQQLSFHARVLAGKVSRKLGIEQTPVERDMVYGGAAGISWHLVRLELGQYDGFYLRFTMMATFTML